MRKWVDIGYKIIKKVIDIEEKNDRIFLRIVIFFFYFIFWIIEFVNVMDFVFFVCVF